MVSMTPLEIVGISFRTWEMTCGGLDRDLVKA